MMRVGDFPMKEGHNLSILGIPEKDNGPYSLAKDIIKRDYGFRNNDILCDQRKEKEGVIRDLLVSSTVTLTELEVSKKFDEFKKEVYTFGSSEQFDKLSSFFVRLVGEGKKTGIDIWESSIKFQSGMTHFEYDSTGCTKVDFLRPLMLAWEEVNTLVTDLLCERITDKKVSKSLERSLKELEQLQMLQWCIIDHNLWTHGTNMYDRAFWRVMTKISQWQSKNE